jgi:transposase InsO family protein
MPNPARDTVAGRVYNDLRNLARLSGRGTDELMLGYVLERFLYRVSVSRDGGAHFITDVTRYIEHRFNTRRIHSGLGYRTPQEVHNESVQQQLAA